MRPAPRRAGEPEAERSPPPPDKQLKQVLGIWSGRLTRAEGVVLEARRARARALEDFRAAVALLRAARQRARDHWDEAKRLFLQLEISSAEFVRRRAVYQKLRKLVLERHADAQRALTLLRECRAAVRAAEAALRVVRRQREKFELFSQALQQRQAEA
ncbi:hypothetical protein OOT46_03820 [Aquabacterium sp. A7-Y]|uniref:hypothetical protein n=1 Tax=Aquabacterium sp. A7-Y TaxID=1349605 RepID=UPI00223E87E1|nr:hypothetical protein [Aquabacterium sp. A7-Y]MCW7536981.1 hypothetical protein [Aquabacterium sp. A7-Y]